MIFKPTDSCTFNLKELYNNYAFEPSKLNRKTRKISKRWRRVDGHPYSWSKNRYRLEYNSCQIFGYSVLEKYFEEEYILEIVGLGN